MWYVTTEPCRVGVLCVRVRDPGKTEWSRRHCTGLAFGKVSISSTVDGSLQTLKPPIELE